MTKNPDMSPNLNKEEIASDKKIEKPEDFYKQVKKDGEQQADAVTRARAYLKELKQAETKKKMEELRKQIGLPKKETTPISLSDLKDRIKDSQHRKLAASDFEPMSVAAQKKPEAGIMQPTDISGAKLTDKAEHTEQRSGFWNKLKSFVTMSRDERAYQKFGQMSAETNETPADRRAAAKGEAMMKKAEKDEGVDKDVKAIKSSRTRDIFMKIDDAPGKMVDKVISDRMYKKAGERATEVEIGLSEGQEEYDLSKKADAFETKHAAMGKAEFKKTMRAGEFRAKAEQLEAEVESEARPGPNVEKGRVNMEKFKQGRVEIYEKLKNLRPIVESIKLGWFAYLKMDNKGYITNLPGGQIDMTIEQLTQKKEKLGAKGDTVGANIIVEQMEALDEYTQLLVERDKLLASAGQDNFLLPKTNR